jgi:hypothetical protein
MKARLVSERVFLVVFALLASLRLCAFALSFLSQLGSDGLTLAVGFNPRWSASRTSAASLRRQAGSLSYIEMSNLEGRARGAADKLPACHAERRLRRRMNALSLQRLDIQKQTRCRV